MGMNPKQRERWEKTRRMGRTRFVWLVGVLGWGVSVGIGWSLAMAAVNGWDRLPTLLPIALIGFPIGGYFFGALTWRWSEKQYEQAKRDDPDD